MPSIKPPSESSEQVALFSWAALAHGKYPELRKLYAIPNGGLRGKATAGKLKAEGVKRGRPDIALDVARGEYHGLRIEMKRRAVKGFKSGVLSEEQRGCISDLESDGYCALVAYGWEEAKDFLIEYLGFGPYKQA